MTRGCGSCTLCCTLMAVQMEPVSTIAKPAGVRCSKLCGKGCSIYEARPDACREWSCLWLHTQTGPTDAMDKRLRPDRSGVVLDLNQRGNIIAHCHRPASWQREPMRGFLCSLARQTHVILDLGENRASQLLPDGTTRELQRIGVDETTNEVKYVLKKAAS